MWAALLMVERYGADAKAAIGAAQATWHRVLDAIERLQARSPAEREAVHHYGGGTPGFQVVRSRLQGPTEPKLRHALTTSIVLKGLPKKILPATLRARSVDFPDV